MRDQSTSSSIQTGLRNPFPGYKETRHTSVRRPRMLLAGAFFGAAILAQVSFAQQFTDVSETAGLHRDYTRAWGNPLWGDFNNDGKLDLFVPNHETPKGVKQGGIL